MGLDIVYGSSLLALQYAVQNNIKIILESPSFPPVYESSENKEDWANLYLQLMIDGNVVGGDSVTAVRIDDDFVFAVGKGNVLNKLKYKNIYIFSDKNIMGLPGPSRKNKSFKVIDSLKPISLGKPHKSYIKTQDRFVNEIHVYKKGKKAKTEIHIISQLSEKQLYQFDYSDTMARFKCESILKEHGFEGSPNGDYTRPLRLDTITRKIIEPMHQYKDTEKIKFVYGN